MRVFDSSTDKLAYAFDYNTKETSSLRDLFSNKESITVDDLRRVSLWKLNRVLDISDDTLEKLTELYHCKNLRYDDPLAIGCLEALVSSQGVGFPMASAMLKFIRPDVFPIIDIRAYRALFGVKITYAQYNVDVYMKYCTKVYEVASECGLELAKVDEQLYMFDKVENGKI